MDLQITTQVVLAGGVMALVMGAVANKTNFCTMGAVSDWVNMGDTGRLRSWFLAIAVAILGVSLLEAFTVVDVGTSRVPYRGSLFFWPRYAFGGLIPLAVLFIKNSNEGGEVDIFEGDKIVYVVVEGFGNVPCDASVSVVIHENESLSAAGS